MDSAAVVARLAALAARKGWPAPEEHRDERLGTHIVQKTNCVLPVEPGTPQAPLDPDGVRSDRLRMSVFLPVDAALFEEQMRNLEAVV